jgi:hypothetical protein
MGGELRRHVFVLATATAAAGATLACGVCDHRDTHGDVVLTVGVDQPCPSLEAARARDRALERGPFVVDVTVLRCCYDVIVESGGSRRQELRCEEHDVESDWPADYITCRATDDRYLLPVLAAGVDAGTGLQGVADGGGYPDASAPPQDRIVTVTGGPRETRRPKERRCVYEKVVGTTTSDACG